MLTQRSPYQLEPPQVSSIPAMHYEIWKYCQGTSKVHASALHNLRVPCTCNQVCPALQPVPPKHSCFMISTASLRRSHYEVWKLCQSTSKVHAQVLQNLRVCQHVPAAGQCRHRAECLSMLSWDTVPATACCKMQRIRMECHSNLPWPPFTIGQAWNVTSIAFARWTQVC